MAFNLEKLTKANQFRFETLSLGELLCRNFSVPVMSEAAQWLESRKIRDSEEFVRHLATLLCHPVDKKEGENYLISKEQAELLTQSEIAEFSRLFIDKNKYILKDQENRETIQKKDNESETDYLLRVVDVYIVQFNKSTTKLLKNATKRIFSNSTLGLLKENQQISESLGASLINPEPFKLPKVPENPVFETNRQLASFAKELNEVAALIKNMNDLGVQMAVESATATARSKLWNNVMFVLGLITLSVTAFLSYLSYTSTNDSSSQVESLLIEQNSLLKIQEENQKRLIEAVSSLAPVLERNIAQGKGEEKILYETSEQLNNITSQSSSKP